MVFLAVLSLWTLPPSRCSLQHSGVQRFHDSQGQLLDLCPQDLHPMCTSLLITQAFYCPLKATCQVPISQAAAVNYGIKPGQGSEEMEPTLHSKEAY